MKDSSVELNLSPKESIANVWNRFKRIATDVDRKERIAELAPSIDRFHLGLFRLVVMGEIKKGKSSFINALLGEKNLLPTLSDVATSTVFKVIYGPQKKIKVFFQMDIDTGRRQEPLEIEPHRLPEFGTESGNPRNQKGVDFIGVEIPNALLKEGIVLVDTPGVGGLYREHRDISWRYAPNADAIFFVVDSVESVISRDELDFLKELSTKITRRIFFVQTKIDACDTEQWEGWRDRNIGLLNRELGIPRDRLFYFPVSSKLKQLADEQFDGDLLTESGFLTLSDFLHRGLLETKQRQLARDVARHVGRSCIPLRREVEEQVRICRQQSREELEQLGKEYRQSREDFDQWERTTYRREMTRFGDRFGDLRQQSLARIQFELDPFGEITKEIIATIRGSDNDAAKLCESANHYQQLCISNAVERFQQIQTEFNQNVVGLIVEITETLARDCSTTDSRELTVETAGPIIRTEESLNMSFSTFDDLRQSLYGGMAGAMIANLGLTLVAVVFPPAAAVAAFAAVIGGLIGGYQAKEIADNRKKEEAVSKLQAILQNLLRNLQQQATNHFTNSCRQFERRARESFEKAAEQARGDLARRISEVEEAQSLSKEASQSKAKELDHVLGQISQLLEVVNMIGSDSAAKKDDRSVVTSQ